MPPYQCSFATVCTAERMRAAMEEAARQAILQYGNNPEAISAAVQTAREKVSSEMKVEFRNAREVGGATFLLMLSPALDV